MANEKEINRPPRGAGKKNSSPVTSFEAFEVWLSENWKLAGAIVVFIILVVAIFAVTVHVNRTLDRSAREAFAKAESTSELAAVLEANPKHILADAARMKLAARYAADKEFAKAAEQYSLAAASTHAELFLRTRAAIDAAYMFEEAKSVNEGIACLENVTSNPNVSKDQLAEALYASARMNLMAGNAAAATAKLDALDANGNSAWRDLGMTLRRSAKSN